MPFSTNFQCLAFDEDFSDVLENESTNDNYSEHMWSLSVAASLEEEKEETKEFIYTEFKEYNPEEFWSTSEMLSLRTPSPWQFSELNKVTNWHREEDFNEHIFDNEPENAFYFILSERGVSDGSQLWSESVNSEGSNKEINFETWSFKSGNIAWRIRETSYAQFDPLKSQINCTKISENLLKINTNDKLDEWK